MKVSRNKFSIFPPDVSGFHISIFPYIRISLFPFYAFAAIFLLSSCKKDSFCNCLKSTGSTITETRNLAAFDQLEIEKNVDVYLVQDSICFVKVTCGKNLMDGISTEVVDEKLNITNKNRCNWSRSFKNTFVVEVHCHDLMNVIFSTSGDLTSLNQFKTDSLYIISDVGTGSIILNLDARMFYGVLNTGSADITVKGKVYAAYLLANGQGFIDSRELENDYAYAQSNASNDLKIRVKGHIDAEIKSEGNIYYYGNPTISIVTYTGSGKIIKAD